MTEARRVRVEGPAGAAIFANDAPFALIAGPCQIESRDHALRIAEALRREAGAVGVPFVFKASYDKANRSSAAGARGVGIEAGLRVRRPHPPTQRRRSSCPRTRGTGPSSR